MCFSNAMSAIEAGAFKAPAYKQMAGIYQQQGQTDLQLSDIASQDALNRGEQAAGQLQVQTGATNSARETLMGASGIEGSSGTSLGQLGSASTLSAYQQAILRNNAAREAWGIRVRGQQAYQGATLKAYGAANEGNAAMWQATGSSAAVAGDFIKMANGGSGGDGGGGLDGGSSGLGDFSAGGAGGGYA